MTDFSLEYLIKPNPDRFCTLEINIDCTAVCCSKCGYEIPKGTNLNEVKLCPSCDREVTYDD